MVDVLFIHPGGQKNIYQELSNNLTAICPPAYTLLLADYVRREGYSVAVYDCNIAYRRSYFQSLKYGEGDGDLEFLLNFYNPKLIILWVYGHHPSASTQTMPIASQIARDIKAINSDIPIAMGGIHPSALPERTLDEAIDYVIRGDGIISISTLLCEVIKKKKEITKAVYSNHIPIDNLDWYFKNYAWDLIPNLSNYRAHNFHCFQYFKDSKREDFSDVRSPYTAIYTSLGCPNNCFYCCANSLYKKGSVRDWKLEIILGWIDELVLKYKVRNIRIHDNLFTNNPFKLEAFGEIMKEKKYDLNLSIYARLDSINKITLTDMKYIGVQWIGIGIENINDVKNKEAKKKIGMIKNFGINTCTNYMFGLPNDTLQSMQETLELALELNTEFANFYCCMAYPGSMLFEDIILRGVLYNPEQKTLPDGWEGYSQHGYLTQPLPTRYLSAKGVLEFRDNAFHTYFSNEKYLNMIDKKFGSKVVKHIEGFNTIRLKRRLLGD